MQRVLFFLLLLFLPTQLGKHFWPSFSFIQGIRIDYLSPTLYLTDILIFLFCSYSTFFVNKNSSRQSFFTRTRHRRIVTLFVCVFLVGTITAVSPFAALYGMIKFFEYFWLFLSLQRFFLSNKKNSIQATILTCFGIGIFYEALLSFVQIISQQSVGGVWYLLGERTFTGSTPGVANVSLDGTLFLRPYGTFSHPNVLAGFSLISCIFLAFFPWGKQSRTVLIFRHIALIVGSSLLLATMSRIAIVLWIIMGAVFISKQLFGQIKNRIYRISSLTILFIVAGAVLSLSPVSHRFVSLSTADESVVVRTDLMAQALYTVEKNPLFGVGLYNYLYHQKVSSVTAPFISLQPVHNIYLLLLEQVGILGFVCIVWLFFYTIKKIWFMPFPYRQLCLLLFLTLAVLGMGDHYLLTLQQGQLLLTVVLGYIWGSES